MSSLSTHKMQTIIYSILSLKKLLIDFCKLVYFKNYFLYSKSGFDRIEAFCKPKHITRYTVNCTYTVPPSLTAVLRGCIRNTLDQALNKDNSCDSLGTVYCTCTVCYLSLFLLSSCTKKFSSLGGFLVVLLFKLIQKIV